MASPALAASEHGYVEGTGGIQGSTAATFTGSTNSGSGGAQIGVRLAPHLFAIGELGRFKSLEPAAVALSVDNAIADLSTNSGVDVAGNTHMGASYGFGGLRVQWKTLHHVAPFAAAGIGAAHLTPKTTLRYIDGSLPGSDPSATMPDVGADVTTQMITAGAFAQPAASTSAVFSGSAGLTFDLARHVTADAAYRLTRIGSSTAITNQGAVFGVGLRF